MARHETLSLQRIRPLAAGFAISGFCKFCVVVEIEKRFVERNARAIPGTKTQFDVTPSLIADGIKFPRGSWAIYDVPSSKVVIWNTPQNDAICWQLLDWGGPGPAMLINVAISVVEYEAKENATISPAPIAVSEFEKQLKSPMRLLSFASGVTRSGQYFAVSNIANASFTDDWQIKPFAKGVTGLEAMLAPTLSPYVEIDLDQIRCCFRSAPEQTDGKSVDLFFTTSSTVKERWPMVVFTQTISDSTNDKPPRGIAVIVSAELISAGGWKIDATGKPIS